MKAKPKKKENIKKSCFICNANDIRGYNQAIDDYEVWLPSEEEIWNILIASHGCKPKKEDCASSKCLRYYKCNDIAKAISKRLEG